MLNRRWFATGPLVVVCAALHAPAAPPTTTSAPAAPTTAPATQPTTTSAPATQPVDDALAKRIAKLRAERLERAKRYLIKRNRERMKTVDWVTRAFATVAIGQIVDSQRVETEEVVQVRVQSPAGQ